MNPRVRNRKAQPTEEGGGKRPVMEFGRNFKSAAPQSSQNDRACPILNSWKERATDNGTDLKIEQHRTLHLKFIFQIP